MSRDKEIEKYVTETTKKNYSPWLYKAIVETGIECAKWADRTMIDKACEWLLQQEEMIGISFTDDFIVRFRKAMEE